jgi:hypothetical protein
MFATISRILVLQKLNAQIPITRNNRIKDKYLVVVQLFKGHLNYAKS